jgi:hypothetical protein
MNLLAGVVVLLGTIVGARRLVAGRFADRLVARLAIATTAFAIFVAAFLLQGFAELVLQRPLIGLPGAAVIVAMILVLAFVTTHRAPTVALRARAKDAAIRPIPRALACVVFATFALLTLLLVAGLPRGYEVHAYHLPIAVRVLRDGTLGLWDDAYMHAFPADASVWAGFFLALLPEHWVSIANLPFHLLLCAAVYGLALAAGADRSASLLATIGLATIPIFGFSALELGADIGGVAFVAVAALLIVTPSTSHPTARALVAGIAAGLAFGFKSLNLVPAAVLGLFLLIDGVRDGTTRRSLHAFAPAFLYAVAAFGTMSFWLARNLVEAGNPLYPVHLGRVFDLFGWHAAPDFTLAARMDSEHEWVARSRDWLFYPWVEGHVYRQNFKHSSGLGPFFAATVPIVVVLWPIRWIAALRAGPLPATLRVQSRLFVVAAVVTIAWWVLGDRQPRYVMVAIAMAMPIVAAFVTMTVGRLRTAYEALLAIGILLMAFVLLVRLGAENGPFLLQQRGATRAQAFQYPPAIDRLPAGSVVANGIDREFSYALLGAGFPNRVVDATLVHRRFAMPGGGLRLTRSGVETLGITHLYVLGDQKVDTDGCVALREVQRFDRNPLNGQALQVARILYAVRVDCR